MTCIVVGEINMKALPKFGPAGNSDSFYKAGYKRTYEAFSWLCEIGLDAYEYQAGNGVRGSEESFRTIGAEAKKHGIALSLHAPYYISLSSVSLETRLKSIDYIKQSLSAAKIMGADTIVVHTGSAAKITREEAMDFASDTLYKTLEALPDNGVIIGLETMGKQNQLGTLEEVIQLCKIDKRFRPVVDFGHLNARGLGGVFVTKDDYRRVFDLIGEELGDDAANKLHCHFSKIEYTTGGEKKHLTFEDDKFGPDYEPLIEAICEEGVSPRIVCESAGTMSDDALKMKEYYKVISANG